MNTGVAFGSACGGAALLPADRSQDKPHHCGRTGHSVLVVWGFALIAASVLATTAVLGAPILSQHVDGRDGNVLVENDNERSTNTAVLHIDPTSRALNSSDPTASPISSKASSSPSAQHALCQAAHESLQQFLAAAPASTTTAAAPVANPPTPAAPASSFANIQQQTAASPQQPKYSDDRAEHPGPRQAAQPLQDALDFFCAQDRAMADRDDHSHGHHSNDAKANSIHDGQDTLAVSAVAEDVAQTDGLVNQQQPGHQLQRERRANTTTSNDNSTTTPTFAPTSTMMPIVTTPTLSPVAPGTRTCSLQQMLNGSCVFNPQACGAEPRPVRLSFLRGRPALLDGRNATVPTLALADFIDCFTPRNVTLDGIVFEEDLLWLVGAIPWSGVTTLGIRGLVSPHFNTSILRNFISLKHLDLASNNLTGLSTAGAADPVAAQVQRLDLRDNSIFQLQAGALQDMSGLLSLNLSNNFITSVSRNVFSSTTGLEELSLQANHISAVDQDAFSRLGNLSNLSLRYNRLSRLEPGVFGALANLTTLDLSDNPLTALHPALFRNTTRLKILDIINSFLTHLPGTLFSTLTKLERLQLLNARLTVLPPAALTNLSSLDYFTASGNRLTDLHPDTFAGCSQLRNLYLNRNQLTRISERTLSRLKNLELLSVGINDITSLPADFLSTNSRLKFLTLSHNFLTHLPDTVLRGKQQLRTLYIGGNMITQMHTSQPLPNLRELDTSDNPLQHMPNATHIPKVQTMRLTHHRISTIDVDPLLSLSRLERFEAAAHPDFHKSTVDVNAGRIQETAEDPSNLAVLDLRNVQLSPRFVQAIRNSDVRLQGVTLGWPGMSEDTFPEHVLCSLLGTEVQEFGVIGTGYRVLNVCPDSRIGSVSMQNNHNLKNLTIPHQLQRLNVSGCVELESLSLLSANTLDISRTALVVGSPICEAWGTQVLVARGLQRPPQRADMDIIGAQILLCLRRLQLVDLSENGWLNRPAMLELSPTVVSTERFWSNDLTRDFSSNTHIPSLILSSSSVACSLKLGTAIVRPRFEADRRNVSTQSTFQFSCRCAGRYTLQDGKCEPSGLSSGEIAAVVVGCMLFVAIVAAFFVHHLRRQVQGEKRLREHEAQAYRDAWNIDYDELEVQEYITRGAFGIVSKALWDATPVAVKELQNAQLYLNESTKAEFAKEVEFFQHARHRNVVSFFGAGEKETGQPFLVLEYVELGSLEDLLHGKDKEESGDFFAKVQPFLAKAFTGSSSTAVIVETSMDKKGVYHASVPVEPEAWDVKYRLAHDIAAGMHFIHKANHLHRDLKSANVLVSKKLRAKITDFGCICEVFTSKDDKAGTDPAGTPDYMAPGVLQGEPPTQQSDVFSYGVLLWELATEQPPRLLLQEDRNKGVQTTTRYLEVLDQLYREGRHLLFPRATQVSPEYKRLTFACMGVKGGSSTQVSFKEVMNHLEEMMDASQDVNRPRAKPMRASQRKTLSFQDKTRRKKRSFMPNPIVPSSHV